MMRNVCSTDPSAPHHNGRKCYHCSGPKCTATLECRGKEDFCFSNIGGVEWSDLFDLCAAEPAANWTPLPPLPLSVTDGGKRSVMKGCATKETCSKDRDGAIKATVKGDISCCQGDFCNSAISASASLLLLLLAAPLTSLLLS